MEINPRFWGTLDLSILAGVDFPLLTCRMALEGDVESVYDYRVGLRYRWTFPDGVRYAMASDRPGRALWEFLRPERSSRSEQRVSDPLPGLIATLWTLPYLLGERTPGIARSGREPEA